MSNILDSFVAVAPYVNQLINKNIIISICDLEKCLLYINGKELDDDSVDPYLVDSVSYESIRSGKKMVKKVEDEVSGDPYLAISIPVEEDGKIIGSVGFFESIDKQDLIMALADNLNDTIQQLKDITELILENSHSIKEFVDDNQDGLINQIHESMTESLKKQISLSNYVNELVMELSERIKRLKESSEDLSEIDV